MHNFRRRSIASHSTLAERLIQARQDKNLALEQCAKKLQIPVKYLAALEKSQTADLPGEIYTRHWLRQYAEILDLSPEECLTQYQEEHIINEQVAEVKPTGKPKFWQRVSLRLFNAKALRNTAILIGVLALLFYVGLIIFNTFKAPVLTFDQPLADFQTQEKNIIISGQTEPGVTIMFNDKEITVDTVGRFSQEVPLKDGLNIVQIRAKKKHSVSFEQTVQIVKTSLPELLK